MFSGKTEELIRRLRRAAIARTHLQIFKPALDTRYSPDEIASHSGQRMASESLHSASEILVRVHDRTEVVGFDEANFFGQSLVAVVNQLAHCGKRVLVAGLDMDYMGRPFPPIPDLLATAEIITKMSAICMQCGNPANYSQRLIHSDDLIVLGAQGAYEARCRACFAGIPRTGDARTRSESELRHFEFELKHNRK